MNGGLIAVLHGHVGGITHIQFSSDGNRIYSGARKVIRIDLAKTVIENLLIGWNDSLLGCEKFRRTFMYLSTSC